MKQQATANNYFLGILMAVGATLIWSGNFIIARSASEHITPVALAFFRWLTAVIVLLPFAWKQIVPSVGVLLKHKTYFFFTALFGITLFNTFVYVAGKSSTAINLALIGTTSSPIMSVILARYFLKEYIQWRRALGIMLCICGILFLLSRGSFSNLVHMHFTVGDIWMLLAAFSFSVYNILARKKPPDISAIGFLFIVFAVGTLLLLPAWLIDLYAQNTVKWTITMIGDVLYLGIGTSVIAFLLWNIAIKELGAGRTALFGNLIPVFSAIEAVIILGEKINWVHLISFLLIITGLLIDNSDMFRKKPHIIK